MSEQLEFVQIAAAKDHLYGMTRAGAVWRYDDARRVWEALPMAFSVATTKPAPPSRERTDVLGVTDR